MTVLAPGPGESSPGLERFLRVSGGGGVHRGFSRPGAQFRLNGGVPFREDKNAMTRFAKLAAGALLVAGTVIGATAALTTPADARVVVGVGIGVPGYYPAYPYYGYYGYPAYYGYYGSPYVWGGGRWHWRGGWGWHHPWGWHRGWRWHR
jgi:hypothetical protein